MHFNISAVSFFMLACINTTIKYTQIEMYPNLSANLIG